MLHSVLMILKWITFYSGSEHIPLFSEPAEIHAPQTLTPSCSNPEEMAILLPSRMAQCHQKILPEIEGKVRLKYCTSPAYIR